MYVENELNKSWKWILTLAGALLLLPQLAMREVTSSEAIYGLMAQHAHFTGNIFSTVTQGELVEEGHLFPWLVNLFSIFGASEFTVRLPSVLGLTIMIFTAAYVTYQYGSRQSAIVAGTCMLSTVAAVKMGTRGEENILAASFISAAWLIWFHYSRKRKMWFQAWFYSLAITSLAAFSSGYYSFLIFYLPMFFMRKPTDIRKRIFHAPHFRAVATIIGLHFIIYLIAINVTANRDQSVNLGLNIMLREYSSSNFINFPFTALFLLLPWTFFSWPAFCEAFKTMEKEPILFHTLRTIVLSLFIICWFLPGSSPIYILPVLVPIAIMTGLHYQILIRRHHTHLRKLIRFTFAVTVIVNIGWLAFFALNFFGTMNINITEKWIFLNSGIAIMAILLAVFMLLKGREYPVWLKIMCMVVLGHWSIITYDSIPKDGIASAKLIGKILNEKIPQDSLVYNLTGQMNSKIMFYIDRRIKFLDEELNADEVDLPATVYVVTSKNKPTSLTSNPAQFKWKPISNSIIGERGPYQAWLGTLKSP